MRYANPVSYPSDVYKKCSAVVCAYVCVCGWVWVWCDVRQPCSRCAVFQCEGGEYDESGTVLLSSAANIVGMPLVGYWGTGYAFFSAQSDAMPKMLYLCPECLRLKTTV